MNKIQIQENKGFIITKIQVFYGMNKIQIQIQINKGIETQVL